MPVVQTITCSVELNETITEGSGKALDQYSTSFTKTFSDGASGSRTINREWNDYRTLGGSSESLDLAGSLVSRAGTSATFARVKSIVITADAANAGNLTIGGGSNPWNTLFTGTVILRPGTQLIISTDDATGYTVTAGTGDLLQVAGASGYSYEIAITGNVA
jgi:hypothetical protein